MTTLRINKGTVTTVRVSLLLCSALAQPLWWRADKQGRCSRLDPVPLDVVGSVTGVASASKYLTSSAGLRDVAMIAVSSAYNAVSTWREGTAMSLLFRRPPRTSCCEGKRIWFNQMGGEGTGR